MDTPIKPLAVIAKEHRCGGTMGLKSTLSNLNVAADSSDEAASLSIKDVSIASLVLLLTNRREGNSVRVRGLPRRILHAAQQEKIGSGNRMSPTQAEITSNRYFCMKIWDGTTQTTAYRVFTQLAQHKPSAGSTT